MQDCRCGALRLERGHFELVCGAVARDRPTGLHWGLELQWFPGQGAQGTKNVSHVEFPPKIIRATRPNKHYPPSTGFNLCTSASVIGTVPTRDHVD